MAPLGDVEMHDSAVCGLMKKSNKKTLHVPIHIATRKILALVDTSASTTFIQFLLQESWGFGNNIR